MEGLLEPVIIMSANTPALLISGLEKAVKPFDPENVQVLSRGMEPTLNLTCDPWRLPLQT
jgi:hypothetical protein